MNKKKIAFIFLIVIMLCIVGKVVNNPANGNDDQLVVHNGEVTRRAINDWLRIAYMFEDSSSDSINQVTVHIVVSTSGMYSGAYGYIGSVKLITGEMIMIGNTPYIFEHIEGIRMLFKKLYS